MAPTPFLILNCSSIQPSAPSIIKEKHPFLASVKLQGSGGLQLAGSEEDIKAALYTIGHEDLAIVDGVMDLSVGSITAKKVNGLLRKPKVERFHSMLSEEMKKFKLTVCPINSYGYFPFPQNTKKTTREQQRVDVIKICKCMDFRCKGYPICSACQISSSERATKELKGE